MPQISASRRNDRSATVFDFLSVLARRCLACRVGSRGMVSVYQSAVGVFTVVHQRRDAVDGEVIEHRIAQLRESEGRYQLFWKKCNGRWTAYCCDGSTEFAGSIAECFSEVSRDRLGCFWS